MFEWLEDYQTLVQEIEYMEYKLDREQTELDRYTGGDLSGTILHPDSISSSLEERIEAMLKEITFRKGQMNKLLHLIDTFTGLDNEIVKLKYIEGYTLEVVAEKLSYSESHIRKKHAALVKCIKFVEKYQPI